MTTYKFKSSGFIKGSKNIDEIIEKQTLLPLGIKTPLQLNRKSLDSLFAMHYEVADQIQDNLRNLMMTNPGERLGRPDYGAGLRELTMEMLATDDFESILMNRIKMTVDKYLPIVELSNFTLEDITAEAYTLQSSMAKVEVIIDYNVPRFQIINKKLAITLFVAG
jgi:phage baseplate assembly protein W